MCLNLQALRALATQAAKFVHRSSYDTVISSPAANKLNNFMKYLCWQVQSNILSKINGQLSIRYSIQLLPINIMICNIPQIRNNRGCTGTKI
jgi:hypothetical protein